MTENRLLMSTQATLLQTEVLRSESTELTAFGAAIAAGLHHHLWKLGEGALKVRFSVPYSLDSIPIRMTPLRVESLTNGRPG